MKFAVAFVLTVVFAVSCDAGKFWDKDDPELKAFAAECAKENNIDMTVLANIGAGQKPDAKTMESHDFKCFGKCMLVKGKIMNDAGDIDYEKVKEKFQVEDSDPMIMNTKECAEKATSTDVCDKTHEITMCVMKKAKKE